MARASNPLFPWRYGMFLALLASAVPLGLVLPWQAALMAGFDIAAFAFSLSLVPLAGHDAGTMRETARRNDANRGLMLLLTAIVMAVILIAVGAEVMVKGGPAALAVALLVVTLVLAWVFSNSVYALHYAHLFYLPDKTGNDSGGLEFPGTSEPHYWDFIYFAFTLGMTFQTSDTAVTATGVRKVATFHCLAAFIFNLGVLAFTINVLGSTSR